jgi:hypothetical protein
MSRGQQLVGWLWHWHRRLGVVAAFFAVLLAVSGIVLNHSSGLGLDRKFVDWPWLSRAYGDNSTELSAFQLGDHWLFRAADGRLYLDAQEVAPCNGKLVGAVQRGELLYAGCAEELLLITRSGELVESISSSTGLLVPLQGLGLIESEVALMVDEGWWLADVETMDFGQRAPAGAIIHQFAAGRLPAVIRQQIPAPDQWLSWERLILDLHSGRVLGRGGVLLVDAVGVLLACLATSGIAMWWLHRRRRRRS